MRSTSPLPPRTRSPARLLWRPGRHSRHASYPVDLGGGAFGLLSYRDVARVPLEDWPEVRVRDVAVPAYEGLVVRPDDELGDALVELAGAKEGRALVLDEGRLAGLLSVTDVSRLLEVRRRRLAR